MTLDPRPLTRPTAQLTSLFVGLLLATGCGLFGGKDDPDEDTERDTEANTPSMCERACDYAFDCLNQECPDADFGAQSDCVSACDDGSFDGQDLLDSTCQQIGDGNCPIGPNDTNTGAPCSSDAQCDGGVLQPFCIVDDGSGWVDGYCVALNCRADENCGEGNLCAQIDEQGSTACFVGCTAPDDAEGDCREGYACPDVSGGQGIGLCLAP